MGDLKLPVIISGKEEESTRRQPVSYYTHIRSVSRISCWECGRMVDSAIVVYDSNGFHHCPPGQCRGFRVSDDEVVVKGQRISRKALLFSIKNDTS